MLVEYNWGVGYCDLTAVRNSICAERKYMLKFAVRDYRDTDLPSNPYVVDFEAIEDPEHISSSPGEIVLVNRTVSKLGHNDDQSLASGVSIVFNKSMSKDDQPQATASEIEPSNSDMMIAQLYAAEISSKTAPTGSNNN
jgi:hypothetical protein